MALVHPVMHAAHMPHPRSPGFGLQSPTGLSHDTSVQTPARELGSNTNAGMPPTMKHDSPARTLPPLVPVYQSASATDDVAFRSPSVYASFAPPPPPPSGAQPLAINRNPAGMPSAELAGHPGWATASSYGSSPSSFFRTPSPASTAYTPFSSTESLHHGINGWHRVGEVPSHVPMPIPMPPTPRTTIVTASGSPANCAVPEPKAPAKEEHATKERKRRWDQNELIAMGQKFVPEWVVRIVTSSEEEKTRGKDKVGRSKTNKTEIAKNAHLLALVVYMEYMRRLNLRGVPEETLPMEEKQTLVRELTYAAERDLSRRRPSREELERTSRQPKKLKGCRTAPLPAAPTMTSKPVAPRRLPAAPPLAIPRL